MSKEYEVQSIMEKRVQFGKVEYKVKWKNYPVDEATWEPERNLTYCPNIISQFNRASGESYQMSQSLVSQKREDSRRQQPRRQQLSREQSEREQSEREQSEREQFRREQSKREQFKREQFKREQPREQLRRQQSQRKRSEQEECFEVQGKEETAILEMYIDKKGEHHFKISVKGKVQVVSRRYLIFADARAIVRFYEQHLRLLPE